MLCVYPLYIDKFSNLGVTKFTGCFTLFLLFLLWLVACTAIGARAPRPRNANAGRDVTLWGVLAFAGTSLISTFTSLSPMASTWGLGGYYGGLMLVLFTAAGYWAVRSYLDLENLDFVFWVLGITTSIVAVLYVLNIFNIDLIGAYADTAVVERAQFFSTLGQKDFNGCFFSVALPIVFLPVPERQRYQNRCLDRHSGSVWRIGAGRCGFRGACPGHRRGGDGAGLP